MLKRTLNYTVNGVSRTAEPTGRTLGELQEWTVSSHHPAEQNQPQYSCQLGSALIHVDARRADALEVLRADGYRSDWLN